MTSEPWYVWTLALSGAIGLPALTVLALDRAAQRAGISRYPAVLAALALTTWLIATSVLAGTGVYHHAGDTAAPWFAVALIGALAVMLAVASSAAAAQRSLPWLFAVPAGLGDLAIGLVAPRLTRHRSHGTNLRAATRFHVLGISDLIVALALGFLCGLGPIHIIPIPPSTAPLSQLPLALIPTAAVPLAITLHVVALTRIRSARGASRETPAVSTAG